MSRHLISFLLFSILVFYVQYPAVPYHIVSLLILYPKELLLLVTVWKWRHAVIRTMKKWSPTRVSRQVHW